MVFAGGATNLPFRRTRIAYLNQQVAADLEKKRSPLQIGLLFSRVFCWSSKKKIKGRRADILKLPQGKKFRTIMGSLGGILGSLR